MAGRRRRPLPAGTRGLPVRTLFAALAEEPPAALEAAAAPEPPPSVGRGAPAAAPAALEALEAAAAAALRLLFSFRFFLSRLAKKSSRLRSSVSAMAAAGWGKESSGGPGQEVSGGALPLLGERGRPAAAATAAAAQARPARAPHA